MRPLPFEISVNISHFTLSFGSLSIQLCFTSVLCTKCVMDPPKGSSSQDKLAKKDSNNPTTSDIPALLKQLMASVEKLHAVAGPSNPLPAKHSKWVEDVNSGSEEDIQVTALKPSRTFEISDKQKAS